jgi:hypothetical protein
MVSDMKTNSGNSAYGYSPFLLLRKGIMLQEFLVEIVTSAYLDAMFATQAFAGYEDYSTEREAQMYAGIIELQSNSRLIKRTTLNLPIDDKFTFKVNKSIPKAMLMGLTDGQILQEQQATLATVDFTQYMKSFTAVDITLAANRYDEALNQNLMVFGDRLNTMALALPVHYDPDYNFPRGIVGEYVLVGPDKFNRLQKGNNVATLGTSSITKKATLPKDILQSFGDDADP